MAIVLNNITSGYNLAKINANFQNIEDYINDKLLARANTGVAGEAMMERALDMNGNKILNVFVDVNDANSLLTVGVADSRYYNVSGDTLTGPMNANGQVINNLPTPTGTSQAANKGYVDAVQEDVNNKYAHVLRFPDSVEEMYGVTGRASSLQGYSDTGRPIPVFSQTATADLAIKLASVGAGLGDTLVAHAKASSTYEADRTVNSILNEIPSIMSFKSSDPNDDTERFTNAIAAGHKHVFIPGVEELGRPVIVGDLKITTPFYIHGVGGKNIDAYCSVIRKKSGSSYGIRFEGDTASRPHGGGIFKVQVRGESQSDTGNLVECETWSYLHFVDCGFNNQVGYGITLKNIAESVIDGCLFRRLGSETTGAILMDSYLTSPNNNTNNFKIINNTFGLNSGHWINGVANSNTDLIWITGNKFEWDDTPVSANTTSHSVINLTNAYRVFINKNGFTFFQASRNMYNDVITIGAASGVKQSIIDNLFYSCSGNLWNIQGGSVLARNNETNLASAPSIASFVCTSTKPQDIENPIYHSDNGNKNKKSFNQVMGWVSSHELNGTINNPFASDSGTGAIAGTALSVPASTEIRRFNISPALMNPKDFVHVTARVKNSSGSSSSITLTVDGVGISTKTILSTSSWSLVTWQLKPSQITSGVCILSNGASPILFDGIYLERKDYFDWSFAYSLTSVPANSTVSTPVQAVADTTGFVATYVVASADGPLNGCILSASMTTTGNVTLYITNPTASEITTSVTRMRIRYFSSYQFD